MMLKSTGVPYGLSCGEKADSRFGARGVTSGRIRSGSDDGKGGSQGGDEHLDGDIALQEAKPKVKKPPLFKVILLNDDYTPMEFVVEVLEIFFRMNREQATHVMLTVHTQGKGVCGIYTRDIAETKMNQVNQYSREHQHPLLCEVEASDG